MDVNENSLGNDLTPENIPKSFSLTPHALVRPLNEIVVVLILSVPYNVDL